MTAADHGETMPDERDRRVFGDLRAVAECFDELPAAVFVFAGPEHVVAAVNRAARALLGPRRELLGRPYREAIPEVAEQRLAELLDRAYRGGQPVSGQERRILVDNDGDGELEELYLTFTIVPIHGADATVRGVVAQVIDMTETVTARLQAQAQASEFAQRYQAAQDVALSLQRSLLPDRLPVLPALAVAAHYLLADREQAAGGDWFDAIPLGDGRLGLAVGDVVGHGAAASAVMAQLRTALTESLLDGHDIIATLARLDRFAARVPAASATTVCLAVVDPATGQLDYACCGHPPPLLLRARGQARFLATGPGGPLGAATTPPRTRTVWLHPADVLLLYTDGLIERPDRPLRVGQEQLRIVAADALTRGTARLTGAAAVERVCALTVECMTRDGHTDDVTLLAARRAETRSQAFHAELPALPGALHPLRTRLDDWLDTLGCSAQDITAVQLAVGEAVSNVIEHAYPDDAGSVRIDGLLDGSGRASLTVTDTGRWQPPPVDPGIRGRGLSLIRDCMDTVEIDSTPGGTWVLMDRHLSRPPVLRTEYSHPPTAAPLRHGFRVEITRGEHPRATVHGPVDITTFTELRHRLHEASRGGALPLIIDLTGVDHLASAGIQVLYHLAEQMAADGRPLRLIAPSHCTAAQALTYTDLHQFTDVIPAHDVLPWA